MAVTYLRSNFGFSFQEQDKTGEYPLATGRSGTRKSWKGAILNPFKEGAQIEKSIA